MRILIGIRQLPTMVIVTASLNSLSGQFASLLDI